MGKKLQISCITHSITIHSLLKTSINLCRWKGKCCNFPRRQRLCPPYSGCNLWCSLSTVMRKDHQEEEVIINMANQKSCGLCDMIFVEFFTRPEFLRPEFYPKKCVNRDNSKFTTKPRKCFKMTNFWQKTCKCFKIKVMADILSLTLYFHFIDAATRATSCAAKLCNSISTSGVLKRSTIAMIVQKTSNIYKMGKYLHAARVNLPVIAHFV